MWVIAPKSTHQMFLGTETKIIYWINPKNEKFIILPATNNILAFPPTNMTTFLTFSSNFIFLFSHFSSHPSSISIISWQQQHNPLAPNTHLFFLRLLTALPFLEVYLRLSVSSCSRFRILSHCDLGFALFDPLLRLCFISFSGFFKYFSFMYLFCLNFQAGFFLHLLEILNGFLLLKNIKICGPNF